MENAYVAEYTGYRHNRYDGYNCSWGVLMALGASKTADCFATDGKDYPNDKFDNAYEGLNEKIQDGNNTEFRKNILENLDLCRNEIMDIEKLDSNEEFNHSEFWGDYEFKLVFSNQCGKIVCDFDGEESFICEF